MSTIQEICDPRFLKTNEYYAVPASRVQEFKSRIEEESHVTYLRDLLDIYGNLLSKYNRTLLQDYVENRDIKYRKPNFIFKAITSTIQDLLKLHDDNIICTEYEIGTLEAKDFPLKYISVPGIDKNVMRGYVDITVGDIMENPDIVFRAGIGKIRKEKILRAVDQFLYQS